MSPEQIRAVVEVDATLRIYLEELEEDGRTMTARTVHADLLRLRSAFPDVDLPAVY